MQNQLQQVKSKNVIQQTELNMIFTKDPKYLPEPCTIQSEVKTLYTTLSDNIRILSDINSELLNIINSTSYAGDIATVNSNLINTTIPQLELSKEPCKSFIAFMTQRVIAEAVNGNYAYQSIKISNDRNYYFFCKGHSDCKSKDNDCKYY